MDSEELESSVRQITASLEDSTENPIVGGHLLGIDIGIEDLVKLYM